MKYSSVFGQYKSLGYFVFLLSKKYFLVPRVKLHCSSLLQGFDRPHYIQFSCLQGFHFEQTNFSHLRQSLSTPLALGYFPSLQGCGYRQSALEMAPKCYICHLVCMNWYFKPRFTPWPRWQRQCKCTCESCLSLVITFLGQRHHISWLNVCTKIAPIVSLPQMREDTDS